MGEHHGLLTALNIAEWSSDQHFEIMADCAALIKRQRRAPLVGWQIGDGRALAVRQVDSREALGQQGQSPQVGGRS
eukprot:107158-Pyramimonas_sp.AAC.1